jgi:hypothetical protein
MGDGRRSSRFICLVDVILRQTKETVVEVDEKCIPKSDDQSEHSCNACNRDAIWMKLNLGCCLCLQSIFFEPRNLGLVFCYLLESLLDPLVLRSP